MISRRILHVVLSLVLLLSQQMAMSHVMSHWTEGGGSAAQASSSDDQKAAKTFASEKHCQQCLAFVQIASAVGTAPLAFAATAGLNGPVLVPTVPAVDRHLFFAFQSRAPPLA